MINLSILLQKNAIAPIDWAANTVKYFKAHQLKIGICSSSSHEKVSAAIEYLGINKQIDATQPAHKDVEGKPSPEPYLTTAIKLGENPKNCLTIEDSNAGVLSAKNAGMKVVFFSAPTKNLKSSNLADLTISSLKELNVETANKLFEKKYLRLKIWKPLIH